MKKYFLLVAIFFSISVFSQDSIQRFWFARTISKFPQLSYSLGEDRLGSAKLGYLDSGVVVKVVDSVGEKYLIQLSKFHSAYLFKTDVQEDSAFAPKSFYLTNNWKVTGGKDEYDTVFMSMDERLPYKSWMEINPSKIMLELYGVQSNTNWITQYTSLKEIKNIYFNQVEDDVVRVTIELQHAQHWGYTIKYNNDTLMMLVKKQPPVLNIQKLKIAIDAGHGGTNTGAAGVSRHVAEKYYTLLFAKALEKYLKSKGVQDVIMTREKDTTFGNTDRVLWLQKQQPDLLVSLHLNSSNDPLINGSSTYYKYIGFKNLSTAILKQMLAVGMNEYGNTGNFNFLLNQPTDFPSALLEIAFLSSVSDERKIMSSKFYTLVAKQVYLGIVDFLNQSK